MDQFEKKIDEENQFNYKFRDRKLRKMKETLVKIISEP